MLFARRDGEDVGFAMFRRTHKWEHARPAGELDASSCRRAGGPARAAAPAGRLRPDRHRQGPDSRRRRPGAAWAGGPRSTSGVETYDSLWVRLVDLPEALAGPHLERAVRRRRRVADTYAPVERRRLADPRRRDGTAAAERTDADADVRLPGRGARRGVPRRRQPGRARPGRAGHRGSARRGRRALARDAHRRRADRGDDVLGDHPAQHLAEDVALAAGHAEAGYQGQRGFPRIDASNTSTVCASVIG